MVVVTNAEHDSDRPVDATSIEPTLTSEAAADSSRRESPGATTTVPDAVDDGLAVTSVCPVADSEVVAAAAEPDDLRAVPLFQSLSGRLPEVVGDLWMLQVHGFAPETATADAVLSDGAATLDPNALA